MVSSAYVLNKLWTHHSFFTLLYPYKANSSQKPDEEQFVLDFYAARGAAVIEVRQNLLFFQFPGPNKGLQIFKYKTIMQASK